MLYQHRVWCITEQKYVHIWDTDDPNHLRQCPNNINHSIDRQWSFIVAATDLSEVIIKEEPPQIIPLSGLKIMTRTHQLRLPENTSINPIQIKPYGSFALIGLQLHYQQGNDIEDILKKTAYRIYQQNKTQRFANDQVRDYYEAIDLLKREQKMDSFYLRTTPALIVYQQSIQVRRHQHKLFQVNAVLPTTSINLNSHFLLMEIRETCSQTSHEILHLLQEYYSITSILIDIIVKCSPKTPDPLEIPLGQIVETGGSSVITRPNTCSQPVPDWIYAPYMSYQQVNLKVYSQLLPLTYITKKNMYLTLKEHLLAAGQWVEFVYDNCSETTKTLNLGVEHIC